MVVDPFKEDLFLGIPLMTLMHFFIQMQIIFFAWSFIYIITQILKVDYYDYCKADPQGHKLQGEEGTQRNN